MTATTTDPTLAGLLARVLAEPDDDFARLVYADALEERGEAERSEFIRVQCELAKVDAEVESLGPCHCSGHDPTGCGRCREGNRRGLWLKWRTLRDRERQLWGWIVSDAYDNHGGVLWGLKAERVTVPSRPVGYESETYVVRRGFVEFVTCTAADWLRHADAILAAHPVTSVTLTTLPTLYAGLRVADFYEPHLYSAGESAFIEIPDAADRREETTRLLRERFSAVRQWHLPGDAP